MNEAADTAVAPPVALRRLVAQIAEGLLLLAVVAAVPAILAAGLLVAPLVVLARRVATRARRGASPCTPPAVTGWWGDRRSRC